MEVHSDGHLLLLNEIPRTNNSAMTCTDPQEGAPMRFTISTPGGDRWFRFAHPLQLHVDQRLGGQGQSVLMGHDGVDGGVLRGGLMNPGRKHLSAGGRLPTGELLPERWGVRPTGRH